jgi:hypothetical protein
MTFGCELHAWGRCTRGLQMHHIINKSALRNAPEALAFVNAHLEFFGAHVCAYHNVSRIADSGEARALFFRNRVEVWGEDYCKEMLEGIQARLKVRRPELELSAILAARPKSPSGRPPEPPGAP